MKTSHKIWIGTGALALAVIGTGATLAAQSRGDVHSLLKGVGADSPTETYGSENICQDSTDWQLAFAAQDAAKDAADKDDTNFAWVQDDVQSILDAVMQTLQEEGVFSDKKMTDEQKAELKAKLKARLGKLHTGMMYRFGSKTFKGFDPDTFKGFGNGKDFTWHNDTQMTEEQRKAFEESMKALKESLKNLPHGHDFAVPPMGNYKMSDEQRKAFEEEMKAYSESMKALRESLKDLPNGHDFAVPPKGDYKMTDEQRKAFEESMKALKESLKNLPSGNDFAVPKMGDYKMSDEQRKALEESMKEYSKSMKDLQEKMKTFNKKEFDEQMKGLHLKLENIGKFMKSLTPEQKKLADKQGYLKPSDLTKEQRDLLGIGNDEEFKGSIKFVVDDKVFTIRSGDKSDGSSTTRSGVITA
ncbi:MAG TPA: hypothetical protein VNI20_05200 [Fimbriimonadaceae bacterium]|nr:hypothetical protein [Fimbriimonadaceae bacterium]